MRHLLIVLGALTAAAGCGLTGPDSRRVVGLIDAGVPAATIEAPDTVRLGAAFGATVNTFGSSSCSTADGVKLTLGPAEARVIPYDRVPTGDDFACTADMSPHPHPVQLRFTELGTAAIVAVGMVIDQTSGERVRGMVTIAVFVLP